MTARPRIGFVSAGGGAGRWRSDWPAQALTLHGHNVVWCRDVWPHGWPAPGSVDVLVVHRPLGPIRLGEMEAHQATGCRVVVQEDDDLNELENLPGLRIGQGPTEQRYDPVAFAPAIEAHDEAIRRADHLVVATAPLAEIYGPMARGVTVVRNRMPKYVARHRFVRPRGDSTVRVGWAGVTGSHRWDLEWIRPQAWRMLAGATFTAVGDARTASMVGAAYNDGGEAWVEDAAEFYGFMARADVGIVPLVPTLRLNRSKSWAKALEYMSLGKPVVGVRLPEQELLIEDGVNGFLTSTPEEFAEAVQVLVQDNALRASFADAARSTAEAGWIEDNVAEWEDALEAVLSVAA